MDKLKGVTKGGWHPAGDRPIHRDSWKSDLKGMATGKKKDPYEYARDHQSAPLSSLKDPESFGPPPRHKDYHVDGGSASQTPTSPHGGWGSAVPTPSRKREQEEEQRRQAEENEANAPPTPYRANTTGLTTDHLPKPPVRRAEGTAPPPPPRNGSPASPSVPTRQPQRQGPPPVLPPRMNDHPDEFTPPPPPPYNEATQTVSKDPALINKGAVTRLSEAGVSVPGFGIGHGVDTTPTEASQNTGHPSQLSELQQRFAKMNTGSVSRESSSPTTSSSAALAAVAHKKPPPPPPPKKPELSGANGSRPNTSDGSNVPPPLPLSSKPRPS